MSDAAAGRKNKPLKREKVRRKKKPTKFYTATKTNEQKKGGAYPAILTKQANSIRR